MNFSEADSIDVKAILGLQLPTDPRWVDLAEKSLEEVLTDHAYCEQKAATSCISLIQRYSRRERIVNELAPIVTEEWGHFRLVLAELHKRGLQLGKQRRDDYVNALSNFCQKGGSEEGRLLDQLLMMAMIEARSCERFSPTIFLYTATLRSLTTDCPSQDVRKEKRNLKRVSTNTSPTWKIVIQISSSITRF